MSIRKQKSKIKGKSSTFKRNKQHKMYWARKRKEYKLGLKQLACETSKDKV